LRDYADPGHDWREAKPYKPYKPGKRGTGRLCHRAGH
jgi:hypothetical protein